MEYDYHEAMKLGHQLCFPLYAAARNVTGLYTPLLKPLGLTYTQYIVFLVLWEKDGVSVTEIGEKLHISAETVKKHIQHMLEITGFRSRTELAVRVRELGLVICDSGSGEP